MRIITALTMVAGAGVVILSLANYANTEARNLAFRSAMIELRPADDLETFREVMELSTKQARANEGDDLHVAACGGAVVLIGLVGLIVASRQKAQPVRSASAGPGTDAPAGAEELNFTGKAS